MSDLPAPLVPSECDLREFPFMPLDTRRLRDSRISATTTGEEFRSAVLLWCASWHQVPASSLPDDDAELGQLAGFGRVQSAWREVRAGALHGWIKCADGRLYHPVIAEKAIKAWNDKLAQRWKKECDRIRKENKRREENGLSSLPLPGAPSEVKAGASVSVQKQTSSGGKQMPASGLRVASAGNPTENALEQNREGEGNRREESISSLCSDHAGANASLFGEAEKPKRGKPPRRHPYPPDAFDRWYGPYPRKSGRGAAEKAFRKIQDSDAVAFDVLVAGLERYCRTKPEWCEWCNPARWLNEKRWTDELAGSNGKSSPSGPASGERRVDFGGGVNWPESSVRRAVEEWRAKPSKWLADLLGPPPGQPGCRVPEHLLARAA